MRVLIACEFSGTVRDAFCALGYDAVSCDLLPSETDGNHVIGDAIELAYGQHWDLMIAHPPCTHLAVSGARWFKDKQVEQQQALQFVQQLLDAPIAHIALENPVSIISSRIRKPNQIIQPWMFGDAFEKKTCLWLKGLPTLVPTDVVAPEDRIVYKSGKSMPRWYAEAWSMPKDDRAKLRSKTFSGMALAMASQWGEYVSNYQQTPLSGDKDK